MKRWEKLKKLFSEVEIKSVVAKDIVIPSRIIDTAIYLSERGEAYFFCGTILKERDAMPLGVWPYYFENMKPSAIKAKIKGFARIRDGCVVLDNFVGDSYNESEKFKYLDKFRVRFPTATNVYYEVVDDTGKECEVLTRACFGLTYNELEKLFAIYAKYFGSDNPYKTLPRLTRSKSFNSCDLTDIWIPGMFPYVNFHFDSGCDFSHVSLFGFYRHVKLLTQTGKTKIIGEFVSELRQEDILDKLSEIDGSFFRALTRQSFY
ncbi:MAG: hypothetical protein FWE16_02285 [Firmicutes bacterium]|nr:hypothetical protein [Bacillota bacterium]